MLAVLGAGSWGSALAVVAASNTQEEVYLWGRDPSIVAEINSKHTNFKYLPEISLPANIVATTNLDDVLTKAKDLLCVVPSSAILSLFERIKNSKCFTSWHSIAWATKGLVGSDCNFIHEKFLQMFSDSIAYGVLSGPSFAIEVARNLPTAVTIAASCQEFFQKLSCCLHNNNFRVYQSSDILGVQLGGVVKNILAVAAGVVDGLALGANARAALITRGFAEGMRLSIKLGVLQNTLYGLAGIGDVILTCTDNKSRNRRFGLLLGQGLSVDAAQTEVGSLIEALPNVKSLITLARKHQVGLPIAEQIQAVLEHNITPTEAIKVLMARPGTVEF